jgi:hypothetical protein
MFADRVLTFLDNHRGAMTLLRYWVQAENSRFAVSNGRFYSLAATWRLGSAEVLAVTVGIDADVQMFVC